MHDVMVAKNSNCYNVIPFVTIKIFIVNLFIDLDSIPNYVLKWLILAVGGAGQVTHTTLVQG